MEFIITTLFIPVEDIEIITTLLLLYMKWMTMLIPLSNEPTNDVSRNIKALKTKQYY